jgi:hypothetical protein
MDPADHIFEYSRQQILTVCHERIPPIVPGVGRHQFLSIFFWSSDPRDYWMWAVPGLRQALAHFDSLILGNRKIQRIRSGRRASCSADWPSSPQITC